MLSSAAGALASLLYLWHRFNKPDIAMACNGLLGGLVAITAPCAFVTPVAAVMIGAIAGLLVSAVGIGMGRKVLLRDPVGASSVHAAAGVWGGLAVGNFSRG